MTDWILILTGCNFGQFTETPLAKIFMCEMGVTIAVVSQS